MLVYCLEKTQLQGQITWGNINWPFVLLKYKKNVIELRNPKKGSWCDTAFYKMYLVIKPICYINIISTLCAL